MMFSVSLSDVTPTQMAGRSHSPARTISAPASRIRRHRAAPARGRGTDADVGVAPTASVLRVSPEEPELERREAHDDREEHPGHRRGGAEVEEAGERRLVQVLDHRPGGVARPAVREYVDLSEDLEGPNDVSYENEEEHRPQEWQRDSPEAAPPPRPVDRCSLVEFPGNVLETRQVDHEVVSGDPPD